MNETIELDALAVFVAVAETMSFTRAAARLGTTKATISRSIAKLESLAGAELVHRTTRSVSLSTAGTALYDRVAPHVAALRGVATSLPESEALPAGELRITAPFDFGVIALPEVVARFGLRFPAVRVDVHLTNDVVDLVAGRFDLAIRAGSGLKSSSLTVRRLGTISLGTYAAPSYVARRGSPRAIGDADHDWAMHRAFVPHARVPKRFVPKVTSNDLYFLRDLLRAGMHVGVLPSFVAAPLCALGELTRVLAPLKGQSAGLSLLYPSSGQVAPKITAFRDVLLETLRARPLPS